MTTADTPPVQAADAEPAPVRPSTYRTTGYRNHVAWGLLGIAAAACLWFAYSIPGAIGLFVVIGLAFVFWYRLGSRGSWMAVLLLGAIMSSILGWQAVTSARCPGNGDVLYMQANKPGVSCDELRASAASMSVLFGFFALMALATPFYARRARRDTALATGADTDA